MSKIEDEIRSEEQAKVEREKAREQAIAEQRAKAWVRWVQEEKPRIVQFRHELNKAFPCLKDDYTVKPRESQYLKAPFVAVIDIEDGDPLQIKYENDTYFLIVPYYNRGRQDFVHELKSDGDLKEQVKAYLQRLRREQDEARRYYDSLPIGNTD